MPNEISPGTPGPRIHVHTTVLTDGTLTVPVNSYLVEGPEAVLVVDTGPGGEPSEELLTAWRRIAGDRPLVVALTHDHWDHFFGNAQFLSGGVPGWGAEASGPTGPGVREFRASAGFVRDRAASAYLQFEEAGAVAPGLPENPGDVLIGELSTLGHGEIEPIATGDTIDLGGGVEVTARVFTGHTETDLVLVVGDVAIVGDLVEEGAPPQFDDALPAAWANSLQDLLGLQGASGAGIGTFLPGHGRPVDRAFVEQQAADIAAVAADEADSAPARTMV
ncbi:MBL fold metallo-hydrolase [Brevibacterium litoralis]|uniref:MBL fold metallo-hydrolase n=1 Tax=Brevibacterium litoralis TaxID=3138935 RepID=UPI0032EAA71B